MSRETPGVRYAEVERETEQSRVRVVLDLDGERRATVNTGIAYFDRMLSVFAFHGCFDLGVSAEGDLDLDDHHTVEDVGLCVGTAIRQAIGDGERINRFGSELAPADDALALVAVDIAGGSYLSFQAKFTCERLGGLSTENVEGFLRSLANHAGATVHVHQLAGHNNHHICESVFKGLGSAFRKAAAKVENVGVKSAKGALR